MPSPAARPKIEVSALPPLARHAQLWALLGVAAIGGAAIGAAPGQMARLVIVALGAALAWFTVVRPSIGLTVVLGLLVLVPLVDFPVKTMGADLDPGILLLWWLAAVGLATTRTGWGAFDVGALLCFGGVLLSTVLGEHPRSDAIEQLWVWIGPYIAGRQLAVAGHARRLLVALALATLALVPFALLEFAGVFSILDVFSWGTNDQAGLGVATERLGLPRVQVSLAQPIPFAIVVACGAVAAAALALLSEGRMRRFWALCVPALIAAQAVALARTGWLLMALVTVIATAHEALRRRIVSARTLAIGAIIAVALISPLGGPTLSLFTNNDSDPLVAASSQYRADLLSQAIHGGLPHPFGTTAAIIGPGGAASIDNLYIWLSWTWGILPVIGLAWFAVAGIIAVFRLRDPYAAVLAALTVALLIIHWNVVLLAQQEVIAWLIFGATAGALARQRLTAAAADEQPSEARS